MWLTADCKLGQRFSGYLMKCIINEQLVSFRSDHVCVIIAVNTLPSCIYNDLTINGSVAGGKILKVIIYKHLCFKWLPWLVIFSPFLFCNLLHRYNIWHFRSHCIFDRVGGKAILESPRNKSLKILMNIWLAFVNWWQGNKTF